MLKIWRWCDVTAGTIASQAIVPKERGEGRRKEDTASTGSSQEDDFTAFNSAELG